MSKEQNEELNFPTTDDYTREDIRKVQERLLEMAICVRDILDRNDIPYFLAFGTLLGAVRHGGYVPWDDDFDLFLFDDSYDKAMEILEAELPSELVVHSRKNDPMYFKAWTSIRDTRTEIVDAGLYNPDHAHLAFQCLALDLYRMKRMPANYVPIYKIEEAIAFFHRKYESGLVDKASHDSEIEALEKKRASILESGSNGEDITEVFAFMVVLRRPFLIAEILPLKEFLFEGLPFKGPACSVAVLNSSYGDYLKLPDFANRKPHYKKAIFNENASQINNKF